MNCSDPLRMESTKIMFHPRRLACFLEGKTTYPIYLEAGISGGCNLRCLFCAFDYLGYKNRFIDSRKYLKTVRELARLGIKSILYSGEGEPLLHPDAAAIVRRTAKAGIDAALATNGILLDKKMSEQILGSLSWVRVSVNAAGDKNYSFIHRAPRGTYDRVLENLKGAVRTKKEKKSGVTIGTQFILLEENFHDAVKLGEKVKDIGVDYFSVKPYIRHNYSLVRKKPLFAEKSLDVLEKRLNKLADGNFKVIFRRRGMTKLLLPKPYEKCLALPFFCKIISSGDVYSCGPYAGIKDFLYGNIYDESFRKIWSGKRRRGVLRRVDKKTDVNGDCMANCRMDEANRFLWELVHPGEHANFI